jgi:Fe(3+) dicitrate transport protein
VTILKTDSTTFQIIRYRTNVSDSRNLGLEAFGELDWLKLVRPNTQHQLSTFINLSYIDARYLSSQQNGYNNKKVEYVPDFIIRTGLTYAYKALSFTLQYAYTSQQFSDASNALSTPSSIYGSIPSYNVADVSAQYKYKAFTLSAGINNAFNAAYFTRRAEGYPGPGIIPGDPLNGYLTLGIKL